MHTFPSRAGSAKPDSAPVRAASGGPPRKVGRAVLLGVLAAAGAMALACDGEGPTSPNAGVRASSTGPQVRGATYTLRTIDGAALPARFAPLEAPQAVANVRLDSGRIAFATDGLARVEWHGVGDPRVGTTRMFQAGYVEDGARVLIHRQGDVSDTGTVSGNVLTVRSQFFRGLSRERYVVIMEYAR